MICDLIIAVAGLLQPTRDSSISNEVSPTNCINKVCFKRGTERNFIGSGSYMMSTSLPAMSHYQGFSRPDNETRWRRAVLKAHRGEHVLLKRMKRTLKDERNVHSFDQNLEWLRVLSSGDKAELRFFFPDAKELNITINNVNIEAMSPFELIRNLQQGLKVLTKKTVIIGWSLTSDNWGWMSTMFPNRTINWGHMLYDEDASIYTSHFQQHELRSFLEDDNLVALIVNQHHNISHAKVISLPLGVMGRSELWKAACLPLEPKKHIILTAGSDWGPRPYIRECVKHRLGDSLSISPVVSVQEHLKMMRASRLVLAMSGLGADTYRLWEALTLGAVPVVERGMGLDRAFYKLPVLLVNDYADLTLDMLQEAYIEALYHADEWEYTRMTRKWYVDLIEGLLREGDAAELQRLHPLPAPFMRPLVPFSCSSCGADTLPHPEISCAVTSDPSWPGEQYNWNWDWSALANDRGRILTSTIDSMPTSIKLRTKTLMQLGFVVIMSWIIFILFIILKRI